MAQKQKCNLNLYRDFLIANHNRYSGLELAKVEPSGNMAHDSVTRWLMAANFRPADLWRYAKPLVSLADGYLIADDTVIGKPRSTNIDLARWQYSGREHASVLGIGVVNLIWSNGLAYVPVDYRVYAPDHDDKSKNDHFKEMVVRARQRGFNPKAVLMDSWYGNVANCKLVSSYGWHWVTNLKSNRFVSETKGTYVRIADLDLSEKQLKHVWLKGYGSIVVGKKTDQNVGITYLASNDLTLSYDELLASWQQRWRIEEFHQGLKQTTGIGKCTAQRTHAQKIHIFGSMVAFLKLEQVREVNGQTWYEQKAEINRLATRTYLANA